MPDISLEGRDRQAKSDRLRNLHPAPHQEPGSSRHRARALILAYSVEGRQRHRSDGRPFQTRPGKIADGSKKGSKASARITLECRTFPTTFRNCSTMAGYDATLFFGETQIRTGHLLLSAYKRPELRRPILNLSKVFGEIKVDMLSTEYRPIWAKSDEYNLQLMDGSGLRATASHGGCRWAPRRHRARPLLPRPDREDQKWRLDGSLAATTKSASASWRVSPFWSHHPAQAREKVVTGGG